MRAVFVNYVHPDVPHVSAMRVRCFADVLAQKGHQIVLLTRTLNDTEASKPAEQVASELLSHDWSRPYHLACAPLPDPRLQALRRGGLLRPVRMAIIAWHYLFRTGVFSDWAEGSRPYWQVLAELFRPEVTWGTFGNTDTLAVARGIARLAGAPWAMDVKDSWDPFIPWLLRGILAKRFGDAAVITVNSLFQAERSRRWFSQEPSIIYSGVPAHLIELPLNFPQEDGFRITLIGSAYNGENLEVFVSGLRVWLSGLRPPERSKVTFSYAGADVKAVERACTDLANLCRIELHTYLELDKLMRLCMASNVNCYLWSPRGFHHKLIELFCCRRPIISFPGEYAEAFVLAKETRGDFNCCKTENELVCCFGLLWSKRGKPQVIGDTSALCRFSWDAQGDRLLKLMRTIVGDRPFIRS
ncbi:MAG TPA: hypothetical protein ENG96_00395 [Gammaproteobacteria bacterium]|nr:hypothetical protein [Gammaproteobacteria bacterium]